MLLVDEDRKVGKGIPPGTWIKASLTNIYKALNPIYHYKIRKWKRQLIASLGKNKYSKLEKKVISSEYDFIKEVHKGEIRENSGEEYLKHPLEVVLELVKLRLEWPYISKAIKHDGIESILKRNEGINKEQGKNFLNKKNHINLRNNLREKEYKGIKRDIEIINDIIAEILTIDKTKNYFEYINNFFNKKNKSNQKFVSHFYEVSEGSKSFDKFLLKHLIRLGILKLKDREKNSFETENLTNEKRLKSLYKDLYVSYRYKSFVLKNIKELNEEDIELAFRALGDLKINSVGVTNNITSELNAKYRKNKVDIVLEAFFKYYKNKNEINDIILKAFSNIDSLKGEYEKKGLLNIIKKEEKSLKENDPRIFNGILYHFYQFIKEGYLRDIKENKSNEESKMYKYFNKYNKEDNGLIKVLGIKNIKDKENIRDYLTDIKFYLCASIFKRYFTNLDIDRRFNIKGFNLKDLDELDSGGKITQQKKTTVNKPYEKMPVASSY